VQEKFKVLPVYTVTQEEGPEHNKVFTVVCAIAGQFEVEGVGKSKKQAEESAAKIALDKILSR
jgi:ribonuclease-3